MEEDGAVSDRMTIGGDAMSTLVDPTRGGRLAELTVDGTDVLVGHASAPDSTAPTRWGCYPMVPWAGRIRRGRFEFRGSAYELPINFGHHAIHGVGVDAEWNVVDRGPDGVELSLGLPADERWPFGGTARQTIRVAGRTLHLELSVTADRAAFPASLGWHPWFRKPQRLEFHPTAMYRRDDDHIAVDELVAVPPGPWDDCFVNERPVVAEIAGRTLRLTSDCTTWVVYDELPHATCIEPQTGPPDAPNIAPRVVEPGETLAAWYRIEHVD
jgi:aldose 1-epimerase